MTTDPLQPLPSNPLAGIAGLGLFAEWLDAIGFISRDANLRALGRAAERWRRTVAGQWSYGRPPRRWVRFEKIDQIVASRMAWISAGPEEPVARAASVLEAWWPDVDAGQLVPLLEQRLSGVLAAAAAEPSLEAKAAALLRWNVPSAFVPPLAVLITHHAIKWEKTDER